MTTKPPKGEKPADTIRFQASQIKLLAERCEQLVLERGKAIGENVAMVRENTRLHNETQALRAQAGDAHNRISMLLQEQMRLQGYIDRVREAEGGPRVHTRPDTDPMFSEVFPARR